MLLPQAWQLNDDLTAHPGRTAPIDSPPPFQCHFPGMATNISYPIQIANAAVSDRSKQIDMI